MHPNDGLQRRIRRVEKSSWFEGEPIRPTKAPLLVRRGNSISLAVPYHPGFGCATKVTRGSSDSPRVCTSRNGKSKFANTTAIHRIQNRYTVFPRADFD